VSFRCASTHYCTGAPKAHHCLSSAHCFDPAKTLILNKSNFALPYMALFNVFRRLMCPSVGPLLHSYSTAAATAARSRSNPAARLFISRIWLCDIRSIQLGNASRSLCNNWQRVQFVPNLWPIIHRPHIASGDCGKWLGISVPADIIGTKTGDYPLKSLQFMRQSESI
jgi:hypothetical protein